MKNTTLLIYLIFPLFLIGQTAFDFKTEQENLGWVASGGSSENSGITSEGYELNWDAYSTPKIKTNSANVNAELTPILAVTVRIRSSKIKTLRMVHLKGIDGISKQYLSEEFLYRSSKAKTFYYDLTNPNWKNYTEDGNHDFFEIGFQDTDNSNINYASSYGELVIEKIEFLESNPVIIEDSSLLKYQTNDWEGDNTATEITDSE